MEEPPKNPEKDNHKPQSNPVPSKANVPPEKGTPKDKAKDEITAGKKSMNPVPEPIASKEPIQKGPKTQAHHKPQIDRQADQEKVHEENPTCKHQATQTLELSNPMEVEDDKSSVDLFGDTPPPSPKARQDE